MFWHHDEISQPSRSSATTMTPSHGAREVSLIKDDLCPPPDPPIARISTIQTRPPSVSAIRSHWARAISRHQTVTLSRGGSPWATARPSAASATLPVNRFGLLDRHDYQLREAFHRIQHERRFAAIPRRDHQLALVIGIDQTDQIAQHDAVLMAQTRTRQDQRRIARIADGNREARRHEGGFARLQRQRFVETCAQVEARAAGRRVGGELIAHARIENLQVEFHAD